jgi:hypothetical protein
MTLSVFGNTMPIHGEILSLIGWELGVDESRLIPDEPARLAEMRRGRRELVRSSGVDFGYDLVQWRELLLTFDEFGYRHPYAFESVDRAVRRAADDPLFLRLGRLLEAELPPPLDVEPRPPVPRCPSCGTSVPVTQYECRACGWRAFPGDRSRWGTSGTCPRCRFGYRWDGSVCSHCGCRAATAGAG